MSDIRKTIRCAIYTRKSTEEGLEQNFNSLQAQRESAEAYVRSQQFGGWIALDARFDDGGYSGATLERPAVQLLLKGIEAGEIDCVVVYKVDRLTRSLIDFARLMTLFERHGVSFVSVTQEFNTTTSLGRLTLNILLSFAQFEREIISERTRDKLSAARRKGKWIGGIPVLGYDVAPQRGQLVVNESEAERVREIFAISERCRSLAEALEAVNQQAHTTKDWVTLGGRHHAAAPFTKQGLSRLLGNVLYQGLISHKGTIYPGEQPAIIDTAQWERVNQILILRRGSQVGKRHHKQPALLAGLARCGQCGESLTATHTMRHGKRHVYYVCPRAKARNGCRQRPVSAPDLESSLRDRLEQLVGSQPSALGLGKALERLTYTSSSRVVQVTLPDGGQFDYTVPVPNRPGVKPIRPKAAGRIPRISKLMALAIKINGLLGEHRIKDYATVAGLGHLTKARLTQIMNLTNLAPVIQEALLFLPKTMEGSDPITERHLRHIAAVVDWAKQREMFRALLASAQPQAAFAPVIGSCK